MSDFSVPNILFAVFQTSNRANGGVESITQVIEALPAEGIVMTQMETPVNDRWREAGKQVEVCPLPYRSGESFRKAGPWRQLKWLFSLVRTNLRVFRLARSGRVQVVHCNDPAPFWHVAWGARLAGAPIVLNLRDTKSEREPFPVRRYRRKFRMCRAVWVLSREMGEFYRQGVGPDFLDRRGIAVDSIYSIVDLQRMQPPTAAERGALRRELGIPDQGLAIGYAAAFNDKKNQLEFLERAGPALRRELPGSRVYFLGDFHPERDPYAGRCAAAAERLDLTGCCDFRGFAKDIEKWYRALDVMLIPTRQEGLARCMIESMACGLPVISFDVCSAREILETHGCGAVVPQSDYAGLVEQLKSCQQDRGRWQKMGERGRTAAEQLFRQDEIIRQYGQRYAQLAAGK